MAGFYTALIGTSPTIQWPGLSPPCTQPGTSPRQPRYLQSTTLRSPCGVADSHGLTISPIWHSCAQRRQVTVRLTAPGCVVSDDLFARFAAKPIPDGCTVCRGAQSMIAQDRRRIMELIAGGDKACTIGFGRHGGDVGALAVNPIQLIPCILGKAIRALRDSLGNDVTEVAPNLVERW